MKAKRASVSETGIGITLGWVANSEGHPLYWIQGRPRAGHQAPSDVVCIPPSGLMTHSVVIAQSGSGKTTLAARLIEEILTKTRARCLVIDPNSDFRFVPTLAGLSSQQASYDPIVGMAKLPTESDPRAFVKEWASVSKTVLLGGPVPESLSGSDYRQVKLYLPSLPLDFIAEDSDPLQASELRHCHRFLQSIVELAGRPGRPVGDADKPDDFDIINEVESVFRFLSNLRKGEGGDLALDTIKVYLTQRYTHPGKADDNQKRSPFLSSLSVGIPIPTLLGVSVGGFGAGLSRIREELDRLLMARWVDQAASAFAYTSDSTARYFFGILRDYRSSGLLWSKSDPPAPSRLEVLDLPSIREPGLRNLVVAAQLQLELARAQRAWELALAGSASADTRSPVFILVDEAHRLAPVQTQDTATQGVRETFRTIAAEGRKFGVFLILVSQRPDKLDPLVLSECDNKAIMRLDSDAVLDTTCAVLGLREFRQELQKCVRARPGRAALAGRWADYRTTFLYVAPRRTREGGASLSPTVRGQPPEAPGPAAAS